MKRLNNKLLVVLLIAFSLTPIIWFWRKPGILINGLDTNFPLDPFVWIGRRFFVWNNVFNAGQDFSSSVAGIFFHSIQVLFYALTKNLQFAEILSLLFWFSAIVLSAYFFIKSIVPNNKWSQLIFVTLYTFNIYLFNTWENVKVANLSLVVGLPLILATLINLTEGKISLKRALLYSAISGIISSGSGINPAYFFTIVLAIIIYYIVLCCSSGNLSELIQITKKYAAVIFTFIVVNLFWILPLINFLFFTAKPGDLKDLGFTNWIDSLSENTSLVNVIRLQGAWDWYAKDGSGQPLYIPYALNYFERLPFIAFSFVVPALVLISLILPNKIKSKYYIFFTLLSLVGIFLSAGTRYPTGNLYRFFIINLPFFSFFRSPWYIFTPFIIISFAGLVALLFEKLSGLTDTWRSKKFVQIAFTFFTAIFVISHLLYSYPLVTGKIFRPGRSDSFYVSFPDYLWQAKSWLSQNNQSHYRIITYPDDQLESFEWGYKGTESIIGLFSNQEYISPSFNYQKHAFGQMLEVFYDYMKKSDYESAIAVARLFAVDTIFVKHDASTISPKVHESIEKVVQKKINFGPWSFYKLDPKNTNQIVFIPKNIYLNKTNYSGFAKVATILETGFVSMEPNDTEVKKIDNYDSLGLILEAKNRLSKDEMSNKEHRFTVLIPVSGVYTLALEKMGLSSDSVKMFVDEIQIDIANQKGNFLIWMNNFSAGEHEIDIVYPESENILSNLDFSNYSDTGSLSEIDLPLAESKTLVAYNEGINKKVIRIPIGDLDLKHNYLFSLDTKFFYGFVPIVEILQSDTRSPLKIFSVGIYNSSDWEVNKSIIEPVGVESSKFEILIHITHTQKSERSKTFMKNFSLKKIYDNRLFLIKEPEVSKLTQPTVEVKRISPIKYEVEVKGVKDDYVLTFLQNFHSGWKIDSNDFKGKPSHITVNGYANSWYIPSGQVDQRLTINYSPQIYFYVGATLSILTFLSIIALNIKERLKSNHER